MYWRILLFIFLGSDLVLAVLPGDAEPPTLIDDPPISIAETINALLREESDSFLAGKTSLPNLDEIAKTDPDLGGYKDKFFLKHLKKSMRKFLLSAQISLYNLHSKWNKILKHPKKVDSQVILKMKETLMTEEKRLKAVLDELGLYMFSDDRTKERSSETEIEEIAY